mgnify:CR=1 FL=1
MRYLIASDIHGALPAAEALTTRFHEEGADRLLLLGDLLYHGPRNPLPEGYAPAEVAKLLNGYADRITAVRGNCDAEVDQMVLDFPCLSDYALVVDADTTLMLTHGHLDLSRVVAGLPAGSFVLSGHTHVKGIGPEVAPAFVKDAGAAESGSKEGAAEACPRCPHSPQSPSSTPAVSATPRTVPPATPSGTMAPWSCARSLVERG